MGERTLGKGVNGMGELSGLPNIGKELERQLEQAGITTAEQLRRVGAQDTWLRIQALDSSACIHRLLALEGAVQEVKKAQLPQERKDELRAFYQAHKL